MHCKKAVMNGKRKTVNMVSLSSHSHVGGARSCLIHGPLFDLCDHLLKLQDKRPPIGEQLPTHVELFKPPPSTAAKVFIIKTAACIDLEDTGLDTFEGKPCDGEAAQATTQVNE